MKREQEIVPLLKLMENALSKPEPNVDFVRGGMREILAMLGAAELAPEPRNGPRAVTIKVAGELLGMCPKTIRNKIHRGEIPAIGSGKSTRVLIDEAIEALRAGARPSKDEVEAAGETWAKRRAQIRAV